MFDTPFLELCSKAHWSVVPLLWIPVSSLWALNSMGQCPAYVPICTSYTSFLPLNHMLIWVFLGVFTWTLLEYVIHRFLFHFDLASSNPLVIATHFLLHGQHHKFPCDPYRLVFPPVPAVIALLLFKALFILLPNPYHDALIAGIVYGYILYDLTHYYIHHGKPSLSYFKRLKAAHTHHHYKDSTSGVHDIFKRLLIYSFLKYSYSSNNI
jgi:hypothetical protein